VGLSVLEEKCSSKFVSLNKGLCLSCTNRAFFVVMEATKTASDEEENSEREQQSHDMIDISSGDAYDGKSSTFSLGRGMLLDDTSANFSSVTLNIDEDRKQLKLPSSSRSIDQTISLGDMSLSWFDGGGATEEGRVFQSGEEVESQLKNFTASGARGAGATNIVLKGQSREVSMPDTIAGAGKTDWYKMYQEATTLSCTPFGSRPNHGDSDTGTSSRFQPVDHLAPSMLHTTNSVALWMGSSSAQSKPFMGSSDVPILGTNCIEMKHLQNISERDCTLEEDAFASSTLRYYNAINDASPVEKLQSEDILLEFLEPQRLDGYTTSQDEPPSLQFGPGNSYDLVDSNHASPGRRMIGEQYYEPANASTNGLENTSSRVAVARSREPSSEDKVYVNAILDYDVLCGRGGKSNHHPGNHVFHAKIAETKPLYKECMQKSAKTKIAQTVVDFINNERHGRFLCLEKDEERRTKRWYVAPNLIARNKAGQALRDDNTAVARAAKRKKYSK
jgi:hypothetical protein